MHLCVIAVNSSCLCCLSVRAESYCAQIIAPITDLTRSRAAEIVKWEDSQEWAFNEIKHLLSSEPILKLPDLDKEFILQTDASNRSLGGCLLQEHDGVRHPVLYANRKLLPREQNYSVGGREALAIIWAVDKFHRYLYGQHFTLESDHRPRRVSTNEPL